jgi:hypothetical protein
MAQNRARSENIGYNILTMRQHTEIDTTTAIKASARYDGANDDGNDEHDNDNTQTLITMRRSPT